MKIIINAINIISHNDISGRLALIRKIFSRGSSAYSRMRLPINIIDFSMIVFALFVLLLPPKQIYAADFSLTPSLSVNEEYTDNVFETDLNKRSEYITRVLPGFAMKYKTPLWDWKLGYTFDYRYYSKGSRKDDNTHEINAEGVLKIIDEVVFVEVNDVYKRVSLDVTRDTTNESLFLNQTDQNIGMVSPYLVLHPSARMTIKAGYRYINTWYKDPKAISKQEHVMFIDDSYELSPKFFLTTNYSFTRENASDSGLNRHEPFIGPRYEYAEKSFVFAQGGVIITDYDNFSSKTVNPSWSAGITHTFDTMTATVSTEVKYSDDPSSTATLETSYAAIVTKNLKQGGSLTLQGSYTEFSDATTDSLQNKRYSTGFTGAFEFLKGLQSTLGLTYEYYDDLWRNAITRKYALESNLSYSIANETTLGLTYHYIDYSSAKIATDNKKINRVVVELKKAF